MEGSTPSADERFAEWYVWAKREIGNDNRVCLGAAQAAVEALEAGEDEQAARVASRRSVAGHGIGLVGRISPRLRAYAEWYDWARREVGGDRQRQHAAARVAIEQLDQGADPVAAAQAAQTAVGLAPPPATPVPPPTVQPAPVPDPAPVPPPTPTGPAFPVTAQAPGWQPPASLEPAPEPQQEVVPPPAGGIPPPPPWPPMAGPAPGYSPAPWPYAATTPAGYAVAAAVPRHVYGGFWRRLGAWAIDSVLLLIGLVIVGFVLFVFALIGIVSSGQDIMDPNLNLGVSLAVYAIAFVLAWLYFAGLESSGWQATIGKRLFGLVVTDLGGRRIGFGRATGRYFSKVTIIGLLFVLFSARRQALQDMMANTLVVRREHLSLITSPPTEAQTRTGPGPAGEVHQGA